MKALQFITVTSISDTVSREIMKHPTLSKIKFKDIVKPDLKHRERHRKLFNCIINIHYLEPEVSKVNEVRIRNCFLQCGQLKELLTAVEQNQTAVEILSLSKIDCECPRS